MEATNLNIITVETTVAASVKEVWSYWNEPKHIKNWYYASDDWHVPNAENEVIEYVIIGGRKVR